MKTFTIEDNGFFKHTNIQTIWTVEADSYEDAIELISNGEGEIEDRTVIEPGEELNYNYKDITNEVKARKIRIVQILDEIGIILLAKTNLTDVEIENAVLDESLDEENLDYEGKLVVTSEKLGLFFERFYLEEVYV